MDLGPARLRLGVAARPSCRGVSLRVIPAKAGIQSPGANVSRLRRTAPRPWMPAFAGTTMVGVTTNRKRRRKRL